MATSYNAVHDIFDAAEARLAVRYIEHLESDDASVKDLKEFHDFNAKRKGVFANDKTAMAVPVTINIVRGAGRVMTINSSEHAVPGEEPAVLVEDATPKEDAAPVKVRQPFADLTPLLD